MSAVDFDAAVARHERAREAWRTVAQIASRSLTEATELLAEVRDEWAEEGSVSSRATFDRIDNFLARHQ